MKDLEELQERIGYRWRDVSLLKTALTHSSYGNQHGIECGERSEFLGDACLDLLVAEWLMVKHPEQREGFMSQERANLVRMCTLATRARDLGLGELVLVAGRSEYLRTVDSVLADTVEAIVGSAHLDGGIDAARRVTVGMGVL